MSSKNLDAPSPKLTIATVAIVVGLHALTAVALASVKTPEMKVEPEKVIPPIEIELITPPPVEIEEVNLKEDPEPVREVKPKPKAKPVAAPKPKVVKKKQPVDKPKAKQPEQPKPAKKDTTPKKSPDTQLADTQRAILAAKEKQAKIDELLAQQQAKANANAAEIAAQVKAAADAKRAQEIANAKAAADAQAKADADARAKADAAEAAASKGPVSFSAGDAQMTNTPKFSIPDSVLRVAEKGDTFNVLLEVTVDKQGRVSSVVLSRKSGNTIVDKAAIRKMRSARFKPFTKNGVPVVGIVTLPVAYAVE